MKMKKILALLLAALMALALTACGGGTTDDGSSTDSTDSANTIVIGVYEPLSGDNGAGGKQEVLGMQYANSVMPEVTIGDTTYQIKLEIADNESSNEKAVSAATQLLSKNPSVILGSYGSGVSIAAAETFNNAGVPAIGVTCTNPQVTDGNPCYFRICFLDPFQGTVLANFAKDELSAKTVYCLGQLGNDYDRHQGQLPREQLRLHLLPDQCQEPGRRRHLRPDLHQLCAADRRAGRRSGHHHPAAGQRHLGLQRHPRRCPEQGHRRLCLHLLR